MKILAISGSLRANSTNTALLNVAAVLAPNDVELIIYRGLGELPHFNPDLDRHPAPVTVTHFRSQLHQSDGVIISSPEYAHGVPGVLKNALDWLVASGELYEKPVALLSASPRATYAQASLVETLDVMKARIVKEACVAVQVPGDQLGRIAIGSNPDLSRPIASALVTFATVIRSLSHPIIV
jgi:chromate reductase, NAD(P)H dehydrogenase (quinone)